MATETAEPGPERGFSGLQCPDCGQADTLVVDLQTLRILCSEDVSGCGKWFDGAQVRALLQNWSALLAWLEAAPLIEPEEPALATGEPGPD